MGLRIGIIGVGGLGYLQAKTYDQLEDVTVVAAADVAADAVRQPRLVQGARPVPGDPGGDHR
jgi:predicted homoserine dehydrogenase-like protein